MEADGKIALVTGANKGIGFEIVQGLASRGAKTFLAARDSDRGEAAAAKLRGEGLDVKFIQIDVTDPASAESAARTVQQDCGRLDILVNNAGINLESVAGLVPLTTPLETVRKTFETNVFGPIAMIQAFLPLLRASKAGRIVNVTSELGSLALASDQSWEHYPHGTLAYGPSKTALNAVMTAYAKALSDTAIKVNAVCPGLTATDLSGNYGSRTAAEGAAAAIRFALIPDDGPTGAIHNDAGRLPW